MVGVKICGLTRQQDAELAVELGAFAVGFVFEPSSPRYVGSPDWCPAWVLELPAKTVAVYRASPSKPPRRCFSAMQAIEWPDEEPIGPGVTQIKVLRPRTGDDLVSLVGQTEGFECVLLDAYDPEKYGGTGKPVDPELARDLVAAIREARPGCQIGLAGGLTPENVARAVEIARPDYVDVASGVESSPGIKDARKMRAFFGALGR